MTARLGRGASPARILFSTLQPWASAFSTLSPFEGFACQHGAFSALSARFGLTASLSACSAALRDTALPRSGEPLYASGQAEALAGAGYLNRYWRYMLALSSTSASVTWVRPREATRSSMRLRIKRRIRKGLRLMRRSASGSHVIRRSSDNLHLSQGVLAHAFYPSEGRGQ